MDGAGEEFLARARFAGDEHVDGGRRDAPDQVEHGLHLLALSDDVPVLAADLALEPGVFFFQPGGLQGPFHGVEQVIQLEGLGDVVLGPVFDGRDGALGVGVGRDHEHRNLGPGLADANKQVDAAFLAQAQVEQDQGDGFPLQHGQGRG